MWIGGSYVWGEHELARISVHPAMMAEREREREVALISRHDVHAAHDLRKVEGGADCTVKDLHTARLSRS